MNKLLTLIAFCAVVATVLADAPGLSEAQKAKVKEYFSDCKAQVKATDAEVEKLKSKDFSNPSDNMKCFTNCFFEKTGTIKDGELQEAVVMEKLGALIGEEKTKTILQKCGGEKGDNKCETAFKIYTCFENAKSEVGV